MGKKTTKAASCQEAIGSFSKSMPSQSSLNIDPFHLSNTVVNALTELWSNPQKLIDMQFDLLKQQLALFNNISNQALADEEPQATTPPSIKDSRFKDEAWETHPMFKFVKESYFLNSSWVKKLLGEIKTLDKHDKHKLEFCTRLLIDAASPSNFLLTNPEVIKETIATDGKNLLKGVGHFFEDIKNGKISTTAFHAFEVGKNLAITKGSVVYQNKLMQLIQYKPLTEEVHQIPLIIIPAWINKYYILDLQEKNSYVKWLVEQGYTVFMISWANPDESMKDISFDDYMQLGPIAAIEEVTKLTGSDKINFVGYCLGGTLLACTLAYLKANAQTPINSATFLTTLLDFEDAGDLMVFIDDEQLKPLEERMSEVGYLEGSEMAQTFSMLRANDMIWSFYVNNYLMGKEPFPFDILYWNADSTRLPAKMHSYYLRQMYQQNNLTKGGIKLLNTSIDLSLIDIPIYFLSTKEDHIAPWKSTYKGSKLMNSNVHFTLSASGHVAGVANHPDRNKYCYWLNSKYPENPDDFLAEAKEVAGSWWVDWNKWASKLSGKKIPARGIVKSLEQAPGSYVMKKL